MLKLSVITITKNEARNIADCLESVCWANELIVVDSESDDNTAEIARSKGAKVLVRKWEGYGATKNFALSQCSNEWILWLDADERISPELREEIHRILSQEPKESGFEIPRRAYFLGKWIKHCGWYPGYIIRLFRKSETRFSESNVHEEVKVIGQIGRLRGDIDHYTDPDLFHYFSKFNRYTSLAATDLHAAGRSFLLADILVRPAFLFLKMYVLRLGFLDGIQGFILSIVSSLYVFTKYAKLWELEITKGDNKSGRSQN